ncbi:MAG: TRAP transporter small permease [Thermodesulfobacteriota bacterium]|nr:TRAP transporter small permease [Thermodesulfobacteriota bacterium]
MGINLLSRVQKISGFFFLLSQLTVAAMMLTTAYDTIMRYFFARPTVWSVELNEVFLVFITLLAGAELVKRNQHIQMDLIYLRLPEGSQRASRILTSIIGILLCGGLFWLGLKTTITTYQGKVYAAGAFRLPFWILYALIPIGMSLMTFEFLCRLIVEFSSEVKRGKSS